MRQVELGQGDLSQQTQFNRFLKEDFGQTVVISKISAAALEQFHMCKC